VKKTTNYTLYMDPFLSMETPLPAIIKINANHNHSITSADALSYLPPTSDMKRRFYDYFDEGEFCFILVLMSTLIYLYYFMAKNHLTIYERVN
jgi:hypothetical protein